MGAESLGTIYGFTARKDTHFVVRADSLPSGGRLYRKKRGNQVCGKLLLEVIFWTPN